MGLTFRKAAYDDLEDIVRIYDRSHDAEEAGLTTTGWKRGIYPVRSVAEASLARGDMYVGELAEILGMSISAVSHQLRVLRSAKLVRGTKEGKEVKYSLDDNHVAMIIECGLSHINE